MSGPKTKRPTTSAHDAALVGKAGEALVAAELLRRHVDVAYPAQDDGVDLLAFRGADLTRIVPIQVKARTSTCYEFEKGWFRTPGQMLVQVWHVTTTPEFYVFAGHDDMAAALGPRHTATRAWLENGAYNVTRPNREQIVRMQDHRDRWERITGLLAN